MALFKGSGVAIVTPLNDNLEIDYSTYGRLLDFHLTNQTDAIIVAGTTGESATLSDAEKIELFGYTKHRIRGRIPVIAGTGSNDTAHSVALSIEAEKCGVDGLLVVTPYYNRTSQSGIVQHYTAIADAVSLPIILYNVPTRTGINMSPETVFTLSQHPNIVGIKEASGDISQVLEIRRLCSQHFDIYSGNDESVVPMLACGSVGVISVVANILPKQTHDMVESFLNGSVEESLKDQLALRPIIDALFIEPNPIPVKCALSLMGYDAMRLRLPLTNASPKTERELSHLLERWRLR